MRKLFTVLSFLMLVYLVTYAVLFSHYSNLDYDGYMNLQVPQSLVKDGIYGSRYNGIRPFWIHIQTGPSVLIPIAMSFKIFGISLSSAKAVFLSYFVFLIFLIVCFYIYLFENWHYTLFFALLSLFFIPSLFGLALNGYGEFPSLFWLILSAFLLITAMERELSCKLSFFSGVSSAMALLTKLLSFIPVFTTIMFLIILLLYHEKRERYIRFTGFWLGGFLTITFVWEIYKFISLVSSYHTVSAYFERWAVLFNAMNMEGKGKHLSIFGYLKRGYDNFLSLSQSLAVNPLLFLASLIISLYVFMRFSNFKGKFTKFIILIPILPHLLWWIFISPSSWFRRVVVPIAGWKVFVLTPAFVHLMECSLKMRRGIWRRFYSFLGALITGVVLVSPFSIFKKVRPPMSYSKKLVAEMEMAEFVKGLPKDAIILGYGWWQSPAISFLSGRDFLNMEDDSKRDIIESGRSFILLGEEHKFLDTASYRKIKTSTAGNKLKGALWFYELYENTNMQFHPSQLKFILKNSDLKNWTSSIDFTSSKKNDEQIGLGVCSYPQGEFRWHGKVNGCLVEERGVVYLKYNGGKKLLLKGYTLPEMQDKIPFDVDVYLNEEYIGRVTISKEGEFEFEMDISHLPINSPVIRVFMRSDKYFILKNRRRYAPFFLADERRLSFVLMWIGLK